MKTKKIIKVLEFLKKSCEDNETNCDYCSFFDMHYGCLLRDFPYKYKVEQIKEELKDKERLF